MDQDIHNDSHTAVVEGQSVSTDTTNCDPLHVPPFSVYVSATEPSGLSSQNESRQNYSAVSRFHLFTGRTLFRASSSAQQRRDNNRFSNPHRGNPLNSGLWISFELLMVMTQIIAAIVVLALSRDENPKTPLSLWIVGYTIGCVAILPLLYWRYQHSHMHNQGANSASVTPASASRTSQSVSHHHEQVEDLERGIPVTVQQQETAEGHSRIVKHVERFKLVLDCFFAIWFIVGNVWIFGGHSSVDEAPKLYRLCVIFLVLCCISYAMPLVICASICCCLPCILTLLSHRESRTHVRGARPDVIASLPVYKFKREDSDKCCKDATDSDSDSSRGGVIAPGTDKERVISGEDAVCCICLGRYKDEVDLKELQCAHFFHAECVERWLEISADCPLCKHEVSS
ncbi:hypothetical protein KP509_10G053900 [Ceratopteris richardii]|uniref:RING-type domain-containing protein n=1 Tax=Ceratopteris richardii TaxID=49495 RepID=A0A8T2U165_CERRI|nr:hypothetical protein KP509_10G053900 [Ceratopteris richardii]KAH7427655.1 hypothetical protein KP509_10G053900 [Ceratopteris richardii]KAH7427656.1 hypothetical protein KP509_10G053900 [Ceratopteris richardii]KAH7427658.1 hypothetical protein KP509_10G053900 [Ceratopteris richardii]